MKKFSKENKFSFSKHLVWVRLMYMLQRHHIIHFVKETNNNVECWHKLNEVARKSDRFYKLILLLLEAVGPVFSFRPNYRF